MKIKINNKTDLVKPSIIREMKALADTFDNVVDFTLGEPHVAHETYKVIKDDLEYRLMNQSIGYSNHYGVVELREAICDYCEMNYQQVYDPKTEIIVTTGVSESISAVLKTVLEEEDEVIIFTPAFPLYNSNIEMYGGKVVAYDMVANNMSVVKEVFNSLITDKTKALLINSPCNPTGKVFSQEDLDVIYDCIKEKPIFVITDEIYRDIVFDNIECPSFSEYPDLRDRLFILNGLSKSFAMTGWRMGYVMGPKEYMATIAIVHQNFVASASTISQYAALEALKHPELTDNIHALYERNRNYVYEQLKPYFKDVVKPEGAFYLYLDAGNYGLSSREFAIKLLEQQRVAVVPGVAFEEGDSTYVRLSYCCDFELLKEGVSRIKMFGKTL